eukprot:3461687-Pleurochrysis_carterae.AAC.1
MMKTQVAAFEDADVQALTVSRSTLSSAADLATTTICYQRTQKPVYFYFPKRALVRNLAPSYLSANGEAAKKHILDIAVGENEKAAFSRLEAWAVETILRTRFYGDRATVETVK